MAVLVCAFHTSPPLSFQISRWIPVTIQSSVSRLWICFFEVIEEAQRQAHDCTLTLGYNIYHATGQLFQGVVFGQVFWEAYMYRVMVWKLGIWVEINMKYILIGI